MHPRSKRTRHCSAASASLELARETRDSELEGHRSRLAQLFESHIGNAIEYGREGVTVTITTPEDGFSIADVGSGIPAEKRDDVLLSGYSTLADGTGFSPMIVTSIGEAHGWDIRVTEYYRTPRECPQD